MTVISNLADFVTPTASFVDISVAEWVAADEMWSGPQGGVLGSVRRIRRLTFGIVARIDPHRIAIFPRRAAEQMAHACHWIDVPHRGGRPIDAHLHTRALISTKKGRKERKERKEGKEERKE